MSDLISRSKLIEALHEDRKSICPHVFCHVPLCSFVEFGIDLDTFIKNQPTVEAKEVVHGKWIKRVKNNGGYVASITCSACGYSHSRVTYNFCPECGADMRGEKNGL